MNWRVLCNIEDLRTIQKKSGDMVRVLTTKGELNIIASTELGKAVAEGFVLAVEVV